MAASKIPNPATADTVSGLRETDHPGRAIDAELNSSSGDFQQTPIMVRRDPAISNALDFAILALRQADSELAKLQAIATGAAALEPFDDDEAVGHLSNMAIDVGGLDADVVQSALNTGFERSRLARADRLSVKVSSCGGRPGIFEPPPKLELVAPWWRDPATIPPRQFLYGRHYIRRAIGATIAAGGRGKTTLSVFEAVTMTAGRNLATGEPLPDGPLRTWVLNGEEDQDELDRRIAAVCQRYRITQADLGGRLFVQSVRDRPLRIATIVNGQPVINAAVQKHMVEFIGDKRIDVFMLDPLISFHGVVENDNSHMDLAVKQGFGVIANKTNSAGELFHHPGKPKPGQADTTVEDGRGASAVLWAVRGARVLNFMMPAEADRLGMSDDKRKLHIRIANGKANMAPLGKAEWMKIEVEELPNGDHVACVSPWAPPNPFQDITVGDMELAQKLARTGAYRDDMRSAEWFGYALAKQLKLAVSYKGQNDQKDLAKLKSIIKTWKDNKVLDVERRAGENRHPKDFIVPGTGARSAPSARCPDDDEASIQ